MKNNAYIIAAKRTAVIPKGGAFRKTRIHELAAPVIGDLLRESKISKDAIEQAEIIIKYGGYLEKEAEAAKKLSKLEDIKIPQDFNYQKLHSISTEGKEKLAEIKPRSIGQASRISGVSPSDVNILLIYMGR